MFRRRREARSENEVVEPDEPVPPADSDVATGGWTPGPDAATDSDATADSDTAAASVTSGVPVTSGPFDEADVPEDGLPRLDLGGMRVPVFEGGELRVEMDEQSGAVIGATVVTGESVLQLHPFAAPRGSGIWDEVRREIAESIEASGGAAEEAAGGFGTELHASVPTQLPDGSMVATPARFVGVDGPRWFLRGVFTGPAAVDADAGALLETAFRRVVVVRGGDPMAPRDPIPLRLPREIAELSAEPAEGPAEEDQPGFDPFHRGPEITEVR
jgi:hypothetical protein